MPRPHKNRIVSSPPQAIVYKPAGVPVNQLGWVTLSLDEYEVVCRLDHQGMDQQAAADLMGVSRPTVTRIYASARKKIATVLAEGMALRIEGGPVVHDQQCPRGRGRGRRGQSCGRGRGRRRAQGLEPNRNTNADNSES